MIEFYKKIFSKPVIMQTPGDKIAIIFLILLGLTVLFLSILAILSLVYFIKKAIKKRKYKRSKKDEN